LDAFTSALFRCFSPFPLICPTDRFVYGRNGTKYKTPENLCCDENNSDNLRPVKQKGGMTVEDEKIVELYWQRSEDAIRETAARYGTYCHSIAYGILHNPQDAEECVSDTWLRTWNALPPQRPTRLQPFLGKITRNLALDAWRRKNALFRGMGQVPMAMEELNHAISSADSAEDSLNEQVLVDALERFLWSLDGEKRQVFLLRYWYFRSEKEIASQLGVTRSKIVSMLHRLRIALKNHLQQEGCICER
jgi:RNA polymerase sigma-70 factor (ECF subfamily)